MPKKENIKFLNDICPPTVKDRSYDAMLSWLFGTEERSIAVCTRIAYKSVKRRFREISKMTEQDKQAYHKEISDLMERFLNDLFNCGLSEQKAFDAWQKEICQELCKATNKYIRNGYTFGLAQYMINLTLKHMLLMERWDKWLEPIRKYLHVPVDGNIMKVASDDLGILIPDINGGAGKYSLAGEETDSKSWKEWEYGEYIKFQDDLRNSVVCPIDWELGLLLDKI